jgi:hypothetical protein
MKYNDANDLFSDFYFRVQQEIEHPSLGIVRDISDAAKDRSVIPRSTSGGWW